MASHSSIYYSFVLSWIYFPYLITTQQTYDNDNCPPFGNASSTSGYNCNGVNRSCQSFLIYRTHQPPYNTITSIASLISANASHMSAIYNNTSVNMTLAINNEVIVPVTCSCAGSNYQANTTHVVQTGESYYTITTDTFKSLTTCDAIRSQKVSSNTLYICPNESLTIPLRCACPTRRQVNDGIRYLLSYVINSGDTVSGIAINFGADIGQTFEANLLSEQGTDIQPNTTLLVPLSNPPNATHLVPLSNPPNATHLVPLQNPPTNTSRMNSNERSSNIVAATVPTVIVFLLLIFGACYFYYRYKAVKPSLDHKGDFIAVNSIQFDFKTIRNATDNFLHRNKLGSGGFGSVYKGKLHNGQEIAVKRLSTNSGQGIEEFKTEVLLVENLQHKNLVKLLGFCLHEEEKLLVYEFLPNASLDKVLLDQDRQPSLDWETRYKILLGIARGLLYLHEDSRLKIIHRDLKLSNILLDEDMSPKIADFGLARLVGRDQSQADTSKIAGTYGYMAPEYALTGRFSIMSDVYSFGVMALEIVTGRMCSSIAFPYEDESICLRAWRLWRDGDILDLVDSRLDGNFLSDEVTRCIHISLLCIQENAKRRPTMAPIVSALNGHHVVLPEPESPPFGPQTNIIQYGSYQVSVQPSTNASINSEDISEIYPR